MFVLLHNDFSPLLCVGRVGGGQTHRNFCTLEAKSLLHSDPRRLNILLSGLLDISSSNSQIMGLGLFLSCLFKIESAHGHLKLNQLMVI